MADQQKVTIQIPLDYGPEERKAIGTEIVDRIIERTREERKDKDGKPFEKYSKKYADIKGVGVSDVDLTLTGEMMDELKVVSHRRGEIEIGYDAGDGQLNGKVEGNRIGSYGQPSGDPDKARDFLGITDGELESILGKYPVDLEGASLDRARSLAIANVEARGIASRSRINLDDSIFGEEE